MSNSFRSSGFFVMPDAETRDLWITQAEVSCKMQSKQLRDHKIDTFESIGERTLLLRHNGNFKTVMSSPVMKIMQQICDEYPDISAMRTQYAEGFSSEFAVSRLGQALRVDTTHLFPAYSSGDYDVRTDIFKKQGDSISRQWRGDAARVSWQESPSSCDGPFLAEARSSLHTCGSEIEALMNITVRLRNEGQVSSFIEVIWDSLLVLARYASLCDKAQIPPEMSDDETRSAQDADEDIAEMFKNLQKKK